MNGPPVGPETVPGLGPVPSPQLIFAVKSPWLAVGVPSTKLATAPLKGEPEVATMALPVPPIALMRPIAPGPCSVTQSFPSAPIATSPLRALGAIRGTVLTTPDVVIRPTLFG